MLHEDKPSLEEAIEHYGVKGMRWGVRKDDRPAGVSAKVNRSARKDAKEFVLAKAYYGKGAGTRRKLIKQTVEGKSKRVPGYKKAFDHHVEKQDTAKAVSKAVSKRSRTDKKEATTKGAKAVARRVTGQAGNAGALVAVGAIGYTYLQNNPQVKQQARNKVSTVLNSDTARKGSAFALKTINRLKNVRTLEDLVNQ